MAEIVRVSLNIHYSSEFNTRRKRASASGQGTRVNSWKAFPWLPNRRRKLRDAQLVPYEFLICLVFGFKGMLARVQRRLATLIPKTALHAP